MKIVLELISKLMALIATYCPSLSKLHPKGNPRYGENDVGNGNLFADYYKNIAHYVPEKRMWYVYDGIVWKPDVEGLLVMQLCKLLAIQLDDYANSLRDNNYILFVDTWSQRHTRMRLLKDAQDVYPVGIGDFDSNLYLLNCQNGVLDLCSFEFRPHSPDDLFTKVTSVDYDPAAWSERLERYIDEVMVGDANKAAYLQKALGYALTGDTSYDCCFFLYGPTARNGKGTLMEAVLTMMGDYGRAAQPSTILRRQQSDSSSPNEDMARLAGARLVSIPELDKQVKLNDALVKTMTGGDTMTVRFLYQNSFQFRPHFKLFVNTNHLPTPSDITLFTSGRVKIIPFTRYFKEEERDYGLRDELKQPKNLSALLNWCITGLRLLRADGFQEPDSVLDAIAEYRQSSDVVGQFIEAEMVQDKNAEVRSKAAYDTYCKWCERGNHDPGTQKGFTDYFRALPFAMVKQKRPKDGGGATTMILGYAIKTSDFDEEAAS